MSLQAACSRQEKGLADRPGQVCLKAVKEGPIRCATARRATRWHVPELDDRGPRRYPDCCAHRLVETAIKAASVGGSRLSWRPFLSGADQGTALALLADAEMFNPTLPLYAQPG